MKVKLLAVLLLLGCGAFAQNVKKPATKPAPKPTATVVRSAATAPTEIVVSWTASTSAAPGNGLTYNAYRGSGTCPAASYAVQNTTPITTLSYTDTAVSGGDYCYYVTAVLNGLESVPSTTAGVNFPTAPAPPTGVTATKQ